MPALGSTTDLCHTLWARNDSYRAFRCPLKSESHQLSLSIPFSSMEHQLWNSSDIVQSDIFKIQFGFAIIHTYFCVRLWLVAVPKPPRGLCREGAAFTQESSILQPPEPPIPVPAQGQNTQQSVGLESEVRINKYKFGCVFSIRSYLTLSPTNWLPALMSDTLCFWRPLLPAVLVEDSLFFIKHMQTELLLCVRQCALHTKWDWSCFELRSLALCTQET